MLPTIIFYCNKIVLAKKVYTNFIKYNFYFMIYEGRYANCRFIQKLFPHVHKYIHIRIHGAKILCKLYKYIGLLLVHIYIKCWILRDRMPSIVSPVSSIEGLLQIFAIDYFSQIKAIRDDIFYRNKKGVCICGFIYYYIIYTMYIIHMYIGHISACWCVDFVRIGNKISALKISN